MSKESLDKAMRNEILSDLMQFIGEHYDVDVHQTGSSSFTFPVVDADRNEKFATIKVTIPRGQRDGLGGYVPFNGYEAEEAYKDEVKEREAKAAARQAKKEAEEAAKARKAAAKQTVKDLNEKGLDAMIHDTTPDYDF